MKIPSELTIVGPRPLRGRVRLPGDKGISHRALLFAAIADGPSRVTGLASGADVTSTRQALAALGVEIRGEGDTVDVVGRGFEGLREPEDVIDCGNSGSTLRMLAGLLAGRPFLSILTGDHSVRSRPMARIVDPLRAMGASIDARASGQAPLAVRGGSLIGQSFSLPTPSGQVKTALVLAGLQAGGTTDVIEPAPSRDHTERLLESSGAPIQRVDETHVRVHAGAPAPFEMVVPGDPSSAAFFVVAALVTPGSEITLEGVSLNPGRLGFVDVLRSMGAAIDVIPGAEELGEPVGELVVRASALSGTEFAPSEAIIDEVPALAVAAAFAEGSTEIRGAGELRVKESDRIATMTQELTELGVQVEARPDGLTIHGGVPRAGVFKSHGDHRVAMAAAIAANALTGESTVRGWQAVAVSYPAFDVDLDRLAAG